MTVIILVVDDENKEKSFVCHTDKHTVQEITNILDQLWSKKKIE